MDISSLGVINNTNRVKADTNTKRVSRIEPSAERIDATRSAAQQQKVVETQILNRSPSAPQSSKNQISNSIAREFSRQLADVSPKSQPSPQKLQAQEQRSAEKQIDQSQASKESAVQKVESQQSSDGARPNRDNVEF